MAEPIEMLLGLLVEIGPINHVLDGSPYLPMGRGNFGERVANCKVQELSAVSCAEMAEVIDLPLGLWPWWAKKSTSSIIFVRWRQCADVGGGHRHS